MFLNLLSRGKLQVLRTAYATLPSPCCKFVYFHASTHAEASVIVLALHLLLLWTWWIYFPLSAKTPNCWTLLSANSPVGLRCSLSSTNETLWQRDFCNFCSQTVMNNPKGILDHHIWEQMPFKKKSRCLHNHLQILPINASVRRRG